VTLTALRAKARIMGFRVDFEDGEYAVYPVATGKDDAYFTTDIDDANATLERRFLEE